MFNTSPTYNIDIENQIRNPSYMKIHLGQLIDHDIVNHTTYTGTTGEYYSNLADIDEIKPVVNKFNTLEHNALLLDGIGILPPESGEPTYEYQGFVGNEVSDSDGMFGSDMHINIVFDQPYYLNGLSLVFDRIRNVYSKSISVEASLSTTLVFNNFYYPDNFEFVTEDRIPASGTFDNLRIYFYSTNPPLRRLIVESLTLGLTKVYTDDDIVNTVWTKEIDLLTTKLPTNNFEFTILDLNHEYDPENTNGILEYVEKPQPMYFEYGYELDDTTIEWIYGGTLKTDGVVKTQSDGSISNVTFTANAELSQLTDIYYKGLLPTTSPSKTQYSLTELAESVFAFVGVTDYYIDPVLDTIYTVLPIPEVPANQALQIIANAGMCILTTRRNGTIAIERFLTYATYTQDDNVVFVFLDNHGYVIGDKLYVENDTGNLVGGTFTVVSSYTNWFTYTATVIQSDSGSINIRKVQDLHLTFQNMLTVPKINKLPELYSILSSYGTLSVAASATTVATQSFGAVDYKTILIAYDDDKYVKDAVASVTAGDYYIITQIPYAKYIEVYFYGSTGTITITGKLVTIARSKVNYIPNPNGKGENCPIDNPLISNNNWTNEYILWVYSILTKRNVYDTDDRGYPNLDEGDIVTVDTMFTNDISAFITKNKLTYNGALQSQTTFVTVT
jgi:hypothetical protein